MRTFISGDIGVKYLQKDLYNNIPSQTRRGLNNSERKRYKKLREISQTFENVDGATFCPLGA